MKIGIIVYSQTGNTWSVALKLQARLAADGHETGIERVNPVGEARLQRPETLLAAMPDVAPYDALVFASPVQGFTLAPAMASLMKTLPALAGKKTVCLVTEYFRHSWLGGQQAIRKMTGLCLEKGAQILGTGIISWSDRQREQQIEDLCVRLAGLF